MTMSRSFKAFCFILLVSSVSFGQRLSDKAISTIDRAMTDELERSRTQMKLRDLIDPFFIAYTVSDNFRLDIAASFGAITRSADSKNRSLNLRLLVGDYKLNDENFSDGGGGLFGGGPQLDMTLPLDDDYDVIRRGFWLATDALFKDANETITKKKAALERKQLSDEDKNLPDFAKAPVANVIEAPKDIAINKAELENSLRELSAIFLKYPDIQNCSVALSYTNNYQFFRSSEGTVYRKPVLNCELIVQATAQAIDDGEPLGLSFSANSTHPDGLNIASRKAQVEKMAQDLTALIRAKKYDDKEYTGPVLFEDDAARDLISDQVISKLSAQREDILGGSVFISFGNKGASFQKKMGTRVLPVTMSLRDNPLLKSTGKLPYLGTYSIDEEGVVPKDMLLIDKGILKTMYMTRTPTKEIAEPNGHARQAGGSTTAGPGIVELIDSKAVKYADMKKDLLKRAKDNGYDFAFIVRSTKRPTLLFTDGMGNIEDMIAGEKSIIPALVYRINGKTGNEELIRGIEISFPTARDLRELITSKERTTIDVGLPGAGGGGFFSFGAKVPATLIGPDKVLIPELEARKKKTSAYPTTPVVMRPN